jgi:hypothetical protein
MTLAQSPTEIPPRCALPPFFKGGQGGISSRSVMKCANLLWSDLARVKEFNLQKYFTYLSPTLVFSLQPSAFSLQPSTLDTQH